MLAATLIIVGIQIFFSSFLLSILGLRRRALAMRIAARRSPRARVAAARLALVLVLTRLEAAPVGQQLRARGSGRSRRDRRRRCALPARPARAGRHGPGADPARAPTGGPRRVRVTATTPAASGLAGTPAGRPQPEGHVTVPLAPVDRVPRTRAGLRRAIRGTGRRPSSTARGGRCGSSGCGPAARPGSTGCRPSRAASATARPIAFGSLAARRSPALLLLLAWAAARLALRDLAGAARVSARSPARPRAGARSWRSLNALVWSLVTPAVPRARRDRARRLRAVPRRDRAASRTSRAAAVFSAEEADLLDALRFNAVVGQRDRATAPCRPRRRQRVVARANEADRGRVSGGGTIESSSQPPLYYALRDARVPRVAVARPARAALAHAADVRPALRRLTALFVFLFLREVLERALGVDGRRAGGRLPAAVRVHRRAACTPDAAASSRPRRRSSGLSPGPSATGSLPSAAR